MANERHDSLDEKLLNAIPPARRILELGCGSGRLGQRYKELNPQASWIGVDRDDEALSVAHQRLDRALCLDLDADSLDPLGDGFDAVVIGGVLEHLRRPDLLLQRLRMLVKHDARLVCRISNVGHVSILERLLIGDLSGNPGISLDAANARFFSPSSAYKMLLDAGWLPNLADHHVTGHADHEMLRHLFAAAARLRASQETAQRNVCVSRLILECTPILAAAPSQPIALSIVVPVNSRLQFDLNIMKSPGLQEISTQIIDIEGAPSAAAAFEAGKARASGEWLLFCHQDVYFPRGSGWALSEYLRALPVGQANDELIGFAGLGVDPQSNVTMPSGLVIDRMRRFDHPASERAISLDEFAVVMSRESRHKLDPALGWHLWATDLCLSAVSSPSPHFARIARVPVFHNSLSDHSLPDPFHESARVLKAKYPQMHVIPTLCGNLK